MKKTVYREELRGFAHGIFFVSAFGFVWASMGVSALPGSTFLLIGSAVVSLALISVAFYLRHSSRSMPEDPKGTFPGGAWRRFQIVGMVEGLAIGVAVFVLVRLGQPEWIPATVALIVGLHFFPLASAFGVRMYHATGALLCAVFALTVVLAPASGMPVVWFVVPGLGSALVLWITGGVLASSGIGAARSSRRIPA